MTYEWDPQKAASNLRRHRVSFAEATSVFLDPVALTFGDPDHSGEEDREITIGTSSNGRVLFVSHCARRDGIRIISARKAARKEREQYVEGIGGGC
ncbi:MAG TPA: BrnT family toxin [Terriglobia bacterium]|nr:BrnT family toxin [Terriglobia bacterium]